MENDISSLVSQVRDYINKPWQQGQLINQSKVWAKVCSCLDVLGDTQLAIDEYQEHPFTNVYQGYLYIHGLFQALYVQSDAIGHLYEAIFKKRIKFSESCEPQLHKIRELRATVSGHPTGQSIQVVRISLDPHSLEYMQINKNDTVERNFVNIDEIIKMQEIAMNTFLRKIISNLHKEFINHCNKYREQKMFELLSKTDYSVTKLQEKDHQIYRLSIIIIQKTLADYETEIKNRYGEDDYCFGMNEVKQIRRLLRLPPWLDNFLLKDRCKRH